MFCVCLLVWSVPCAIIWPSTLILISEPVFWHITVWNFFDKSLVGWDPEINVVTSPSDLSKDIELLWWYIEKGNCGAAGTSLGCEAPFLLVFNICAWPSVGEGTTVFVVLLVIMYLLAKSTSVQSIFLIIITLPAHGLLVGTGIWTVFKLLAGRLSAGVLIPTSLSALVITISSSEGVKAPLKLPLRDPVSGRKLLVYIT